MMRVQLANTGEAIISRLRFPMGTGGRSVAAQVMVATPAPRNMIREGRAPQIPHVLTSGEAYGTQPMDPALAKLRQDDLVRVDTARRQAHDAEPFDRHLGAL